MRSFPLKQHVCACGYNCIKVSLKSLSNLVDPTMWFPSVPNVPLQGAQSDSSGNRGSYSNYSSALSVTDFASVKSQDVQTDVILISQVKQEEGG